MTEEREIKLTVPDGFVLPDLSGAAAGLHVVDRGEHVLEATYWDTETLSLQRAGFGLRYRTTDGGEGHWTLKAQSRREGPAVVREEDDIAGQPHEPPARALQRVRDVLGDDTLRPVVTLSTTRHTFDLVDAGGTRLAEVADDRVSVRDDGREVAAFREVEVELTGPLAPDRVDAVLERLRSAGAGTIDPTAKYVRGLRALGFDVPPGERS